MPNGSEQSPTPNDRARWLRPGSEPSGGGYPNGDRGQDYPYDDYPYDDYPYDDYPYESTAYGIGQGAPTELDKKKRRRAVAAIAATLMLAFLFIVLWPSGDDDTDDVDAGPGPSTPASTSAATSSPPPQTSTSGVATPPPPVTSTLPPPPPPASAGIAALDDILAGLGISVGEGDPRLAKRPDAIRDLIDSISTLVAAYQDGTIDIKTFFAAVARLAEAEVDTAFNNSTFECSDQADGRLVVCPDGVLPMPAGDVVTVGMQLEAPVPFAAADRSYIYSVVFDSDGDPANDWVFSPPFDFDLFQGADRWYQLIWDHNAGEWRLTVTQVDGDQRLDLALSAVRAVVENDTIVFFVPRSELPADTPLYRVTAFGHDGAFSENDRGADVSGADPTAALLPVPAESVVPSAPPRTG